MGAIEADVLVIGAGVVGLAVAESLLSKNSRLTVCVIERHPHFGQETSSHHSEVIHAGLYYKGLEVKQSLCIRGRDLLYDYCHRYKIPHKNCGKYILASSNEHLSKLEEIGRHAQSIGVPIEFVDGEAVRRKYSNLKPLAALWSPSTGIADSHQVMVRMIRNIEDCGGYVLFKHEFINAELRSDGSWEVRILSPDKESIEVRTRVVINSSGLSAGRVARTFNPELDVEIRACRGHYFSMSSRWENQFDALLYPVPDPKGGLGVHLTFDTSGRCRLGPDVDWTTEDSDDPSDPKLYQFGGREATLHEAFFESGRKLIPELEFRDLAPEGIGVRPKLFIGGILYKDFFFHRGNGQDWHLLGIESPGFTSSLAIAERMTGEIFTVL